LVREQKILARFGQETGSLYIKAIVSLDSPTAGGLHVGDIGDLQQLGKTGT
jgi:hypothetical protein